jgi:WD40 repeat protein
VRIERFAFSPDGQTIATVDERGRVRLRPAIEAGGIERDLDVLNCGRAVAFSPDGRHLAVGGDGPDVVLYDLRPGRQQRPLGIPVRGTSDLRFSPDGRTLAVSSHDSREVIVWDIEAGRPRLILRGHTSSVMTMAFAPCGRLLASASSKEVVIWDLAVDRPLHRFTSPMNGVVCLAYSPDSRLLAIANTGDRSVRIRDVQTGAQVLVIAGRAHPPISEVFANPATSVAFSPDGRLLATAAGDRIASLWSVASGRELRRLVGQVPRLWKVAFSPDGCTLAATGDDDDIRFWNVDGRISE